MPGYYVFFNVCIWYEFCRSIVCQLHSILSPIVKCGEIIFERVVSKNPNYYYSIKVDERSQDRLP